MGTTASSEQRFLTLDSVHVLYALTELPKCPDSDSCVHRQVQRQTRYAIAKELRQALHAVPYTACYEYEDGLHPLPMQHLRRNDITLSEWYSLWKGGRWFCGMDRRNTFLYLHRSDANTLFELAKKLFENDAVV